MWNIPIITPILGYLMKLCYWICNNNYAIALIIFTLIVKLITVPSQIKQQKSTAKMAKFSPKLKQLQKQYANNKQKLQEETMKLYSEEGVNPMGSCLPMVITMVILFGVVGVVYSPLNYISNIGDSKFSLLSTKNSTITEAENLVTDVIILANRMDGKSYSELTDEEIEKIFTVKTLEDSDNNEINDVKISKSDVSEKELERAQKVFSEYFPNNKEFVKFLTDDDKLSPKLYQRPQLLLFQISEAEDNEGNNLSYGKMFDVVYDGFSKDLAEVDYTFFGIPLSVMPTWKSFYLIIPILSLISQLALTILSQYFQRKNNPGANKMGMGMNAMLYIMPLFSFWISFNFPAGLGLYWTLSAVYSLIQTVVLNKIYTPEKVAKMEAKNSKKKKRPSMYERALAAQGGNVPNTNGSRAVVLDENGNEKKMSKEEKKAYDRQRIAEARKRMAEKYGEEYLDD